MGEMVRRLVVLRSTGLFVQRPVFWAPLRSGSVMWVVTGYMQNPSPVCPPVPERCCSGLSTDSGGIAQRLEQSRLQEP